MSMRQMKAWVLTMEWSTGVNEGTVSLEPIRVLSGVSEAGGALGSIQVRGGYMPRTAGRPAVEARAMIVRSF